jgi:PBSX family phage terminase large subunit
MQTIIKPLKLHRAQGAFRESNAFYRGFVGGRGSGKSWVGAYDVIRRAKRGRTYLVGSPTSILLHDVTYPTFQTIARDLGVWGRAKLVSGRYPNVFLTTGAVVRFRTAEDPEKMRGPNLSGVWLDEASLMDVEAYNICIPALREAGEQGWLSATFTPKGLTHWTYDTFGKKDQRGHLRPDTFLINSKTSDNPFLPAGFQQTIAKQISPNLALQELEGRFVNVEGAEWPASYFTDDIYFDEWPAQISMRTIGIDPSKSKDGKYGDYFAIVRLGIDKDMTLWCEADLAVRSAEEGVDAGIEHQRQFKAEVFACEANQFLDLFINLFNERSRAQQVPMPIVPIQNTAPKLVRIRRLGPYLMSKKIRFKGGSPGTTLLVQQLRDFPLADHDDGPDALEMALRVMIDLWNGRQKEMPRRVRA